MLILNYKSKKKLKENIRKKLKYNETSIINKEYKSTGTLYGSNRPKVTKNGTREFFATISLKNNLIIKI